MGRKLRAVSRFADGRVGRKLRAVSRFADGRVGIELRVGTPRGPWGGMSNYTNVLAAVDFSPCGHAAMAHASRLAGGAPIDVVHVLVAPRELDEKQSAKFRATIEQAVRDSALGIQIRRIFLPTGGIADAILQTAGEARADVLVVGTHGRRGLEHFLTGSVAEEIVRRAVIPVLVVRATNCGDVTLFDVEQALIDEQDG